MVKRSIDQKLRSRNFDARNERIETGAIAGINVVLKEGQENAINGRHKDSVRKEIVVVFDTMRISVHGRHQRPFLPLNHRLKRMAENSSRRKSLRGQSPSGK